MMGHFWLMCFISTAISVRAGGTLSGDITMGFMWEVGSDWVCLYWIIVFGLQMLIAEISRRWVWAVFAVWTLGGVLIAPYAIIHGVPMIEGFPFDRFVVMVATATMTASLLFWGKRHPEKAHRYAFWMGFALWVGLALNIVEADIRDTIIFFENDSYLACTSNTQCLQDIDATRAVSMINGLPKTRGLTSEPPSPQWYQDVAAVFAAKGIGIDPSTGFRTIGGYWNLLSTATGFLNIITVTGLGKIFITSRRDVKVRGLIWADMAGPWIIAYDLWNHAFLYNSLADYTWHYTLALLLACIVPVSTWAKGQGIWFRCFTLMSWIVTNSILPELLAIPSSMASYATMNPVANIICCWAAFLLGLGLFMWGVWVVVAKRRNPFINYLFFELGAFRKVIKAHTDNRDKYFLTDRIPETPTELGLEPDTDQPPIDTWPVK